LAVEDRFFEMAGGAGAAGVRRAVYDPLTGESKLLESDSSKLLKLAGTRPAYDNFEYGVSHVGNNLISAEESRNQQQFSVLSSVSFSTDFSSDKCMDIRVGDVLEIMMSPSLTSSSLYSGLWLVNKAIHTLEQGNLSSKYIVTRGEFNLVAQKAVIDSNSYEASSSAPGIDFAPVAQTDIASSQQTPVSALNTGDGISVQIQSPT